MLTDLHLHTYLSDGYLDPADIEQMAKERYARAGVADHISPYHQIRDEKAFRHYLKEIGKFDILRGGELCLGPKHAISAASLSELDYIIGSVHALSFGEGLNFFFFDKAVRFPDIPLFIQTYVDAVVRFLNTIKMDILGHPLLLPFFLQKVPSEELFTDEQLDAVVRAGALNGVAFEISSRWRVPELRFLKICAERGATVSLGSDAHAREGAFDFDYPLQMIEEAGLDMDRVFVPKLRR